MIGFAVLFGLLAVFIAQSWLTNQAEMRLRSLEAQNQKKPIATQTIVVASKALRFGGELGSSSLREMPWPDDSIPAGAFKKISDITSGNGRRVVLTAIEANEPILASKITGPGQRATVGTGSDVLIGGFVIAGTQSKRIILRAIGPSPGHGLR
jgi:pilus assembly protein CpaB